MPKSSHMSTFLTVLGAAGVIATSIAAVKATPKAIRIIEEEKKQKEELTNKEAIKAAWKCYIPAIAIGMSTIVCIFGANMLNKRQQASLMSAYALLSNSYSKFRKKTNELYGEEAEHKIINEIAKDEYLDDDYPREENGELFNDDECLFYDFVSQQYFSATMDEVIQKVTMDDGLECYIITTPYDLSASYYVNL